MTAGGRVTLMVHNYVGEDLQATLQQAKGTVHTLHAQSLGLLDALVKSLDVSCHQR